MNSFHWVQPYSGHHEKGLYKVSRRKPEDRPYTGHCPEHEDWENWWVPECPVHDGLGHLNWGKKKEKVDRQLEFYAQTKQPYQQHLL